MTAFYVKTEAGREAIRSRSATLSRPARNLLLIVDDTKDGEEWVALVNGATPADLEQLFAAGLVAEVSGQPRAAPRTAPASVQAPTGPGIDVVLQGLSYRDLYDRLTADARPRLGLIKGYRKVLEIEKCSGPEEIRKLALRFIDEVRTVQGDAAAREFCRSLGADV